MGVFLTTQSVPFPLFLDVGPSKSHAIGNLCLGTHKQSLNLFIDRLILSTTLVDCKFVVKGTAVGEKSPNPYFIYLEPSFSDLVPNPIPEPENGRVSRLCVE